MDKNFELTLREILSMIKKRLSFIFLVTLSVALLSYGGSRMIVPTYACESTLTLALGWNYTAGDTQKLMDTFPILLKNQGLLEQVVEKLNLDLDAGQLANRISAAEIGSTGVFTLTVRESDPGKAASVTKAILELMPEKISSTLSLEQVNIITLAQTVRYVSPNIQGNLITGVFIGFSAACVAVFLLELLSDKFKSEEHVRARLGCPVIGVIPDYRVVMRKFWMLKRPVRKLLLSEMASVPVMEAFHSLRTNLKLSVDRPVQKIMITSSISGEGKTTIAVNLAIALGRLGSKVLLIDLNFRNPAVNQYLRLDGGDGVSFLPDGNTSILNSVVYCRELGISVLAPDAAPPDPNELLQSDALKNGIRLLEKEFDFIIYDTPALFVYADAAEISSFADGVVFVVRQNDTRFDIAQHCKNSLELVKANVIGCVLNAYRADKTNHPNASLYCNHRFYRAKRNNK